MFIRALFTLCFTFSLVSISLAADNFFADKDEARYMLDFSKKLGEKSGINGLLDASFNNHKEATTNKDTKMANVAAKLGWYQLATASVMYSMIVKNDPAPEIKQEIEVRKEIRDEISNGVGAYCKLFKISHDACMKRYDDTLDLCKTMFSVSTEGAKSFAGKWDMSKGGKNHGYGGEISITKNTGDSFQFEFQGNSWGTAGVYAGDMEGTAKILSPTRAVFAITDSDCEKGFVHFELVKENLRVTSEGEESCFGFGRGVIIDGDYTKGKPKSKK